MPRYGTAADLKDSAALRFLAAVLANPSAAFMVFYVGTLLYLFGYGVYRGIFRSTAIRSTSALARLWACLLCGIVIGEWRDMKKNPWVSFVLFAVSLALMVVSVLGNGFSLLGILTLIGGAA